MARYQLISNPNSGHPEYKYISDTKIDNNNNRKRTITIADIYIENCFFVKLKYFLGILLFNEPYNDRKIDKKTWMMAITPYSDGDRYRVSIGNKINGDNLFITLDTK